MKKAVLLIVFLATAVAGMLFHFSQLVGVRIEDLSTSSTLGKIFGYAFLEAGAVTALVWVVPLILKTKKIVS